MHFGKCLFTHILQTMEVVYTLGAQSSKEFCDILSFTNLEEEQFCLKNSNNENGNERCGWNSTTGLVQKVRNGCERGSCRFR